jgi:hypothetical protein
MGIHSKNVAAGEIYFCQPVRLMDGRIERTRVLTLFTREGFHRVELLPVGKDLVPGWETKAAGIVLIPAAP